MHCFFNKKRETFLLLAFMLGIFLVFSSNACAERESVSYEHIIMNIEGGGQITLVETGSSPHIEYYTANLSFFPKNYGLSQIITKQQFRSDSASQITSGDDGVLYRWDNPPIGKINFGFESQVSNFMNFPKIREKIKFPISNNIGFAEYLSSEEMIYPDNTETKILATQIVEGEDDLYNAVYKLGAWVNANIKYTSNEETAEISRDSKWVLQNRIGVCDEITNLFVAMTRSVGIPAKFVSGVAYSNQINDFGNHAWSEVYFPGTGWVPFDVTYGEYGFIDSTHIKFKDGVNGESSVDYVWRGRNVESEINGFKVEVEMTDNTSLVKWNMDVDLKVLKNNVGAGSYVPIMITIKNKEDFYLPVTLYATKAPTRVTDTKFSTLIPPLSEKKIFATAQVPDELKEGYSYFSVFEVSDFFESKTASNVINYGAQNDYYSKENANLMISNLNEEYVSYSSEISSNCEFDKELYYAGENAVLKCKVQNTGNINLDEVQMCVRNECQNFELFIADKKEMQFIIPLKTDSDEFMMSIKSENLSKHEYLNAKVYLLPNLTFSEVNIPASLKYKDVADVTFNISTSSPVQYVSIEICRKNIFETDILKGMNDFKVPVYGSLFYKKECNLEANYKNLAGEKEKISIPLNVSVTDAPLYARYSILITLLIILAVSSALIMFVRKKTRHITLHSAPHKRSSKDARKELHEMMPHKHKKTKKKN